MKRPQSLQFLILFTLCAWILFIPAISAAETSDDTGIISTFELQLAGRNIQYLQTDQTEPTAYYGFDFGLEAAGYPKATMLGGWNGIEAAIRIGYLDSLTFLLRIASLWTVLGTEHLNLSIGPGGELFAILTTEPIEKASYIQPHISLRLGLAAGPLALRTEYDFHFIRKAHHLRTYLPLFGGIGVGLELGFDRTINDSLALNNASALLLYQF